MAFTRSLVPLLDPLVAQCPASARIIGRFAPIIRRNLGTEATHTRPFRTAPPPPKPSGQPRPKAGQPRPKASRTGHLPRPSGNETASRGRLVPPPPRIAPTAPLLPYHVSRTASRQYPVYQKNKRGGNMLLTEVRRVSGDSHALRAELREYLDLYEERVYVNHTTKAVMVKGHFRDKIKQFLEEKNF